MYQTGHMEVFKEQISPFIRRNRSRRQMVPITRLPLVYAARSTGIEQHVLLYHNTVICVQVYLLHAKKHDIKVTRLYVFSAKLCTL